MPRDADGRWIGVTARSDDAEVQTAAHATLVAGVVTAVTRLWKDEALRRQMGAAGRQEYQDKYTPELAAKTLQGFYDEAWVGLG